MILTLTALAAELEAGIYAGNRLLGLSKLGEWSLLRARNYVVCVSGAGKSGNASSSIIRH